MQVQMKRAGEDREKLNKEFQRRACQLRRSRPWQLRRASQLRKPCQVPGSHVGAPKLHAASLTSGGLRAVTNLASLHPGGLGCVLDKKKGGMIHASRPSLP